MPSCCRTEEGCGALELSSPAEGRMILKVELELPDWFSSVLGVVLSYLDPKNLLQGDSRVVGT